MRVLVACEFFGIVRDAFIKRGHEATSCDLLPTETPGPHYQGDVFDIINDEWDLMIAHPPCTHLSLSGAKHFEKKRKDGRQQEGIDLFMKFANSNVPRYCIENPANIMSRIWRKPDQVIQPYHFGDEAQKTTWLWLKNLPFLIHAGEPNLFNDPITHVGKGEFVTTPSGKRLPKWYSDNKNPKIRSKTFSGIAEAMAEQWGKNNCGDCGTSVPNCPYPWATGKPDFCKEWTKE